MKRNGMLLLLFLTVFVLRLGAQEIYSRPFSEDHKVWLYQVFWNPSELYKEYFTEGDTIIEGKKCFKVYLRQDGVVSYECAVFDEGRKTYVLDAGEMTPRLLYDFDATCGDILSIQNGIDVLQVSVDKDTLIECNGKVFRELSLHNAAYPDDPSNPDYYTEPSVGYWIEGIGGSGRYFPYSAWWDGYNQMYFSACMIDGELVYSNEYYSPIVNAIGNKPVGKLVDGAVYDLQGRRVGQGNNMTEYQGNKLPKGIYIQNGRKVVMK